MLGCPRSLALFPPQWLMVPDLHLEMPGTRLSLGLPKQQLSHPEGFGSERPQEIIFEDSPHRPSGLPILAHINPWKKTEKNSVKFRHLQGWQQKLHLWLGSAGHFSNAPGPCSPHQLPDHPRPPPGHHFGSQRRLGWWIGCAEWSEVELGRYHLGG